MMYKLGKKAPLNKKAIKFGDFLTTIPTTPLVDFAPNYVYPMDENDTLGNCVVAGFDHIRQVITGLLTGTPLNFTTAQIEAFYATQNPNGSDNGMNIQTFLEYLVANKLIVGFARIDWTNRAELQAAIYLGLSIMTGVQLQQAQETQFQNNQLWDTVANSPILGGHCVPLNGYNNNPNILDIVTWGKLIGGTENFVLNQMDEAWFILMQEHIDHPNFRNHFDLQGFSTAVSEITDGKIFIPVNPTVTLTRATDDGKETQGRLDTTGFGCVTLERPWLNNQPNISCVPKGTYSCILSHMDNLNIDAYELQNVEGRSSIFIHFGNYASGNTINTDGCILVGSLLRDINGDKELDATDSRDIFNQFMTFMGGKPFTLIIQ